MLAAFVLALALQRLLATAPTASGAPQPGGRRSPAT